MPETSPRIDYRATLNLPKTPFPLRAELPKREPDRIRWWAEQKTYEKRLAANAGNPPFILHDGPPYANGDLHMGHFLNRVLKDAFVKINLLDGRWADFVPGWDMHGLPIERETVVHLGIDFHAIDPLELREKCRERALYWLDRQRDAMLRMGLFGHFDDPYMTITRGFEGEIVDTLGDLAEAGQLYKGLRSTLWCVYDETALAEAEIEYKDHISPSIYVRFTANSDQQADIEHRFRAPSSPKPLSVIIWTTTPWTLPANVAIALNETADYGLYETATERYIVATALHEHVRARFADPEAPEQLVATVRGEALIRAAVRHPFLDRDSIIVTADYVELETGTGAVHTAPGHGTDDFDTGVHYDLPILNPVDGAGKFTREAGEHYSGMQIFAAQETIIADLRASGHLVAVESYEHSYPHCWRCKNPVVFRATAQWFISMDANGLRHKIEATIPGVHWTPAWGEERMTQMIANHPEWCISRQRTWGTPIPAVRCDACQESIVAPAVARIVATRFRADGAGVWWTDPVEAFLPEGFACPNCANTTFSKEMNIVDIWFESGVTHRAVLKARGLPWPADVYLEGSDQYRGWFRSNLITAVATMGAAPYRNVVSTGWVVDEDGRAMHKSTGNFIGAVDAMEKYGADVLRLWIASVDYTADLRIGAKLLENVANVYRNLRNRFAWYLGTIADLTPETLVPREEMEPIDRLALARVDAVAKEIVEAYRAYQLHDAYLALQKLDSDDLSAFYVDALKDRTYTGARDGKPRRSAQSAVFEIFRTVAVLLAPVLSFTAEEAWQFAPEALRGKHASIFDVTFPHIDVVDEDALATWETLKSLRANVASNTGLTNYQLDARVEVPATQLAAFEALGDGVRDMLMVSTLLDLRAGDAPRVTVQPANGEKCERCRKYLPLGLVPEDPTICAPCAEIVHHVDR